MQVLMVSSSYYPIKGGAETIIRNLSIKLNEAGITTHIMTFNMNRKWEPRWRAEVEEVDGISIFRVPALNWCPIEHSDRITLGVNLIPGLFRNRLRNYDIIHFHGEDLTFPLFSYTAKRPKIFHSHGFSLSFYQKYFLSRLMFRNIADLYISISQTMNRELVALGIPPRKIRYLPNAVDTKFFHPVEKNDDNLVLFVGRIAFDKGLHVLLESLKYVKTKIHLVIIGPPGSDAGYFREMQKRIEEENKKRIHEITYLGEQEQESIKEWYQKASIFVLPSLREAFPVTILEALSCGTPVVATDVGGISEVIREGENGLLLQANDAKGLAESIQHLLDNAGARIELGQKGRALVMERFSYDIIVKKLCDIYKHLLEQEKNSSVALS